MGRYLHNEPLDELAPDLATKFAEARERILNWSVQPPPPTDAVSRRRLSFIDVRRAL